MEMKPERIARHSDTGLCSGAVAESEVAPEPGADDALRVNSDGVDPAQLHPRLQAMIRAALHHGVELDPKEFKQPVGATDPPAAALSLWAQNSGMWSRAVRIPWRHLLRFQDTGPVV